METDQEACKAAASCPAPSQGPVKTGWLSSNKRGPPVTKPPSDGTSRFQGDGVRYKAKLIGVDYVPAAQGDKMCLDSMMKLKGQEVAGRNQGRHKQRVWLKVSITGVKILDERTGVVEYDHERGKINSLTKDESDPRALSYIYDHEGTYTLFYIKMANLADPVLDDIKEVCQSPVAQEDQVIKVNKPVENAVALLLLDENIASPKGLDDLEMFNSMPNSPSGQPKQISSRDELRDIFSFPSQNSDMNQPVPQIFPTVPGQPIAVASFISPPVSIPWCQQGPLPTLSPSLNGSWGAPAPWPSQPNMTGWIPGPGGMMPYGGPQLQGYGVNPQPGVMWGQNTMSFPTSAPNYTPYRAEGLQQQPGSPTTNNKPAQG
ncbi:disabled homolog 2-like isoform X2 [Salvelinus fontinalis]|uniref:disabled homolog 2-like isoform X2 n=1 Tax=Salvelinus fontinalis TaxID=8038 RepID=UPI00248674D6|nr:disabled homolog 2-like isoform X2 [Salvelinus fontinalis]